MHPLNKTFRWLLTTAVIVFLPAANSAEPLSHGQQLISYLSKITTIFATFEQATQADRSHPGERYSGSLWIAKPNQFRVNTESPSVQSLVSDGRDLWTYDEDLEQVVVSRLNTDINQVPLLLFSSDVDNLEASYNIDGYTDEDGEHFLLQPISEISLFQNLRIDFKGDIPTAISIAATTGQRTTISLKVLRLNDEIPANRFEFKAPEGVDVIDDRN